jgi:hypothetical protein
MRISEIIKPFKSKSPEKLRIDTLKKAADQASAAVGMERQRQRLNKARTTMAKLNQTG